VDRPTSWATAVAAADAAAAEPFIERTRASLFL